MEKARERERSQYVISRFGIQKSGEKSKTHYLNAAGLGLGFSLMTSEKAGGKDTHRTEEQLKKRYARKKERQLRRREKLRIRELVKDKKKEAEVLKRKA